MQFLSHSTDILLCHSENFANDKAFSKPEIQFRLEKNKVGDPYVKNALAFKAMVAHTNSPDDFLAMPQVRPFLLTAAGFPGIKTSFVGAAIETAMAGEIYGQLSDSILSNAANLTDNNQLIEYCNWLIEL